MRKVKTKHETDMRITNFDTNPTQKTETAFKGPKQFYN